MRSRARVRSPSSSSRLMLHEGINCLAFDGDGDITPGLGRGLYYDDIRYLSCWQLRLDDEQVQGLGARIREPNTSICFVTNPKLEGARRETLGIVRTRILDGGVREEIAITNHGDDEARFELSLKFGADFLDVSKVEESYEKGEPPPKPKGLHAEALPDHRGILLEMTHDDVALATRILFDKPARIKKRRAIFRVRIPRGETYRLYVEVQPVAIEGRGRPHRVLDTEERRRHALIERRREERRIIGSTPTLETDHAVLSIVYAHAIRDMASLSMTEIEDVEAEGRTVAAGVPWYTALFGRDALTAARLMLLADPDLAKGTLRILGRLQGTKCDESTHEQPGKILHAYRRNLARGETRRSARFRTLDATPLYLLLACEHVRHQGELSLIEELWPTLERAVEWMESFGDFDGDGLLEHDSKSGGGWKDSSDSVRYRDGRVVKPPVALIEIQGYAARALFLFAELCDRMGRGGWGERMRGRAERIREEILRRYWMEERSFFAQALDGDKRQVDSLTSNAGQLLWYRAIPEDYAHEIVRVLCSDVFFSGWGIRTRARGEGGYNPISYHNGSIWPHDTAIIASGFAAYGYRQEAKKVLEGLLRAIEQCEEMRPPEVFAGYPSVPFEVPIAYFGANPLQAWASAGVVESVRTLLGLEVNALDRRISLCPFALEEMSFLAWRGVHMGGNRVDIEVRFDDDGTSHAEVRGLPKDWKIEGGVSAEGIHPPASLH